MTKEALENLICTHMGNKFLIEGSKLNLQGQGSSKRKGYAKKGSLIEVIIPSSGT